MNPLETSSRASDREERGHPPEGLRPGTGQVRNGMKLQQGQLWQCSAGTLRIVKLERLAVEYKTVPAAEAEAEADSGARQRVTKKEFCRLIKGAVLTPPEV